MRVRERESQCPCSLYVVFSPIRTDQVHLKGKRCIHTLVIRKRCTLSPAGEAHNTINCLSCYHQLLILWIETHIYSLCSDFPNIWLKLALQLDGNLATRRWSPCCHTSSSYWLVWVPALKMMMGWSGIWGDRINLLKLQRLDEAP